VQAPEAQLSNNCVIINKYSKCRTSVTVLNDHYYISD